MILRDATDDDVEAILRLARQSVGEIVHVKSIDDNVLGEYLCGFIAGDDYFSKVADDDGEVKGIFVGRVTPNLHNLQRTCEGVAGFMSPSRRGTGMLRQFYSEFFEWSDAHDNVSDVRLQTSAGAHLDFTKLLGRFNMPPVGDVFYKVNSHRRKFSNSKDIRFATTGDISTIVEFIIKKQALITPIRNADRDRLTVALSSMVYNPDFLVRLAVDKRDRIQAVGCFRIVQTFWNTERCCETLFIFGSQWYKLLVDATNWGSSRMDVTHFRSQTSIGDTVQAHESLGFKRIGKVFMRGVPCQ
jgi:hypothetical protein